MDNHVIVINGKPRAGKDTAVKLMTIEFERLGYRVKSVSSIDCVREFLKKAGIDTSRKTDKDRDLLAEIGTALEKYNDFRTNTVVEEINWGMSTLTNQGAVTFVHMRELFMRDKLCKILHDWDVKFSSVFVNRDVKNILSNNSDANVEEGTYDIVIENNTDLSGLMSECLKAVKQIVELEEQIPKDVYYSRETDQFYSLISFMRMDSNFYRKWYNRSSEFPTRKDQENA